MHHICRHGSPTHSYAPFHYHGPRRHPLDPLGSIRHRKVYGQDVRDRLGGPSTGQAYSRRREEPEAHDGTDGSVQSDSQVQQSGWTGSRAGACKGIVSLRRDSAKSATCRPFPHIRLFSSTSPHRSTHLSGSSSNYFRVLALESSADDSCAAIVDSDRRILSNVVIKQHDLNAKWGGIYPLEAQHAHEANIPRALRQALDQAKLGVDQVDAIAYTRGPGMRSCLAACATSAKALAAAHGKPLFGIHHMQAHALTPLLTEQDPPRFPFLTLLASGGHTQLVLVNSLNAYKIICNTLDLQVGRAFDKVARFLCLPASSTESPGAVLSRYAALAPLAPYDTQPLSPLTIPLSASPQERARLDYTFSGVVSAVSRALDKQEINEAEKREGSRLFQIAAVEHLVGKTRQAIRSLEAQGLTGLQGLVISGGVGANSLLRQRMKQMLEERALHGNCPKIQAYYPPIELCTDNAVMIASAAILRIRDGRQGERYDLPIRPKWSLEDLYDDIEPSE